jgi:hypothetical protein
MQSLGSTVEYRNMMRPPSISVGAATPNSKSPSRPRDAALFYAHGKMNFQMSVLNTLAQMLNDRFWPNSVLRLSAEAR